MMDLQDETFDPPFPDMKDLYRQTRSRLFPATGFLLRTVAGIVLYDCMVILVVATRVSGWSVALWQRTNGITASVKPMAFFYAIESQRAAWHDRLAAGLIGLLFRLYSRTIHRLALHCRRGIGEWAEQAEVDTPAGGGEG